MISNVLRCKGYVAEIGFDETADAFHGTIIGINDVVDFYGRSVEELKLEFERSIDEYAAWCREEGVEPERTTVERAVPEISEQR